MMADNQMSNKMIENAIVVFDTSSIGKLYHLTEGSKNSLLQILSEYFGDRIWLPSRVWEEYTRHQREFIKQPLGEFYSTPQFLLSKNHVYFKLLKDFVESLKKQSDYHPAFSEQYIREITDLYAQLNTTVDKIRLKTEEQLSERKAEINTLLEKGDSVYDTFVQFSKADNLSYQDILQIVKEGDIRYKHRIPPGYMDDGKESIDKFGDLIIWKEVLDFAKKNESDIIFITNDRKQDWYANSEKNIPREELIREFASVSNKKIIILPLEKFISLLKEKFPPSQDRLPLWNGIEQIHVELEERKNQERLLSQQAITVDCLDCKERVYYDIDETEPEWHCEDVSYGKHGERSTTYHTNLWLSCPSCGTNHEIDLQVTRTENRNDDIECDSSNNCVVKKVTQAVVDSIKENTFKQCQRCGQWFNESELSDSELCSDCEDYYMNLD